MSSSSNGSGSPLSLAHRLCEVIDDGELLLLDDRTNKALQKNTIKTLTKPTANQPITFFGLFWGLRLTGLGDSTAGALQAV